MNIKCIGHLTCCFLNIEDLTIKDHRAFVEHIGFLTVRAMHDHFKDVAHTEYDCAIRRLAETQGFAAFGKENNGASIVYYGRKICVPKRPSEYLKDGKRRCFRWNKEYGSSRSEDECGYGHWCATCGSKNHKRTAIVKD